MRTRWKAETKTLAPRRIEQTQLSDSRGLLTWGDVIELWRSSPEFADWFSDLLASAPFEAVFWETPPLTHAALNRPFEYVLVDSPALIAVQPDPIAFAAYFQPGKAIVEFENLGRDACLIAPCPGEAGDNYAHLSAFLRCAPEHTRRALWSALAKALEQRLSDQPLWCSTSGLGIFWLHLRLDARPKYYTFDPYRHDRLMTEGQLASREKPEPQNRPS